MDVLAGLDMGPGLNGGVWGNIGYTAADGETFADNGDGTWWFCPPAEFEIIDEKQLILTYAEEGTASWSKVTFWRFKSTKK